MHENVTKCKLLLETGTTQTENYCVDRITSTNDSQDRNFLNLGQNFRLSVNHDNLFTVQNLNKQEFETMFNKTFIVFINHNTQ